MQDKLYQANPIELAKHINNFFKEIYELNIKLERANARIRELETALIIIKELNKLRD